MTNAYEIIEKYRRENFVQNRRGEPSRGSGIGTGNDYSMIIHNLWNRVSNLEIFNLKGCSKILELKKNIMALATPELDRTISLFKGGNSTIEDGEEVQITDENIMHIDKVLRDLRKYDPDLYNKLIAG